MIVNDAYTDVKEGDDLLLIMIRIDYDDRK